MFDRPNLKSNNQATNSDRAYVSPPPAVTLPKGGGAIRGIGEKFSVNPVTGTGSLSVPIFTTPSRSDFYPQLSLSYDSGAGNGAFGLGWNLSVPSVTRKTDKGLPRYFDGEDSDVFILSGAEDLVPVLIRNGDKWEEDRPTNIPGAEDYIVRRYRPRIEGLFARIERWQHRKTGAIHWRSLSQDNVTSIYGRSKELNSRIVDSADESRVFKWLLEASYDDRGNLIVYQYKQENSEGRDESAPQESHRLTKEYKYANVYLKHIWYGNRKPYRQATNPPQKDYLKIIQDGDDDWLFRVVFDYGEHGIDNATLQDLDKPGLDEGNWNQLKPEDLSTDTPTPNEVRSWFHRPDAFSTHRAGFEIRTQRLCRRVLMFHRLDEKGKVLDAPKDWHLVRSTDFGYEKDSVATYLVAAKQTGYARDGAGYRRRWMPPLEMHYDRPQIQDTIQIIDSESLENLPMGLDGSQYQWVDLDSEGISGILTEQGTGWFYKRNLGAAKFAPQELVATKPSLAVLQSPQQRVMDLAGDGTQDLVLLGTLTGYYQREADGEWRNFSPFESTPNIDWNDPNLRFIDLNGDGHADILITQDELFVWYPSQARQGFGAAEMVRKTQDEEQGAALVFADGTQSVYLADMSGDGLNDLVRIRNGEVCYWSSLGYGRFGAKVTMDWSPYFDHPELFDQKRVRLADIDGSGTTDIIYLGREAIAVWLNQAGNSWRKPTYITNFPTSDNLAAVQVVDLLGNGTACIVWSSPLPGQAHQPMQYIDLMGGQKPHLMTSVVNNLGAETKLKYVSSTHFYLKDRKEGKPWITRLPFPVHVVERVATGDRITGNNFVTRYAYHHGYFDGEEREFRGFGLVEQWDTEEYTVFQAGGGTNAQEKSLYVPPVHTKTWFHTGAFIDREHISNFFAAKEYYREPQHRIPEQTSEEERRKLEKQFQTTLLPDTILPDGLTAQEEREACRALKGQVLRQEIYAVDGSEQSQHPYSVSERNYQIRQLQPRQKGQYAVFFTHPHETINYHYERNPEEPRISHEMTLEVDEFGNVLKSAAIGYPRRQPQYEEQGGIKIQRGELSKQEGKPLITYQENWLVNHPHEKDWYRIGVTIESRTYEITGLSVEIKEIVLGERKSHYFVPYSLDFIKEKLKTTAEIAYEETPESGKLQKRLIECSRTLYRKDAEANTTDPTEPLKLGQIESLVLPYESYEMAFTSGLLEVYDSSKIQIDSITPTTPEVFRSTLEGLLRDEGKYLKSKDLKDKGLFLTSDKDGDWWIPSGRQAFAPEKFYLPTNIKDPFGKTFFTTYDNYVLLVKQTKDPLKNIVQVTNNYRMMQPEKITDPNSNQEAVRFDALGMVVATAVMGKVGETDPKKMGDTLDDPTTSLEYDLFNWKQHQRPTYVKTRAREEHRSSTTRWQESYTYSDGFGREIQTKVQAEPGKAPLRNPVTGELVRGNGKLKFGQVSSRWVGTGRIIYNNKGNPVKQYEPFFSSTHQYETEQDLVEWGVTPILFYDPLERVVATLHPNHTYEKVVFDPWQQATWDVNDTVEQADPRTDPDVGHFFQDLPHEEYLPTWHTLRTDAQMALAQWPDVDPQTQKSLPGNAKIRAAEKAAAEKAAIHGETPTIGHLDTLGRPFLTIAHNKFQKTDEIDPATGNLKIVDEKYETAVKLDIEGNPLVITDARQNRVMEYAYDMSGPDEDEEGEEEDTHRIYLKSMDAGERWTLNNVAGNPIRTWDSRQQQFRYKYDALQRPIHLFVRYDREGQGRQEEILAERIVYGEEVGSDAAKYNLRGEVSQQSAGAGVETNREYDFKGNLLRSRRKLAKDYNLRLDWSANPAMEESEIFENSTVYDALNRTIQMVAPHDVKKATIKTDIIQPLYNEANLLEQVHVWLKHEGEPKKLLNPLTADLPAVTKINYNAKGQRTLIEYGNGTKTTYTYDPLTFRLTHLFTTRGATFPNDCPKPPPEGWPRCGLQSLHYTYDPVGNITHIRDDAQQRIFFKNKRVDPDAD